MEVLTEVDRGRIAALRARDEFFWLDLERPVAGGAGRRRRAARRCTRSRSRTRASSTSAPKLDRYPDAVLLVYWTARTADDGAAIEPIEVHLHISGGFLFTVRRAPCRGARRAARRRSCPDDAEAEDYIVYRVLDALTDALYPVVDQLEARIDALEEQVLQRHRPPPARRRSTGSSRRCSCC